MRWSKQEPSSVRLKMLSSWLFSSHAILCLPHDRILPWIPEKQQNKGLLKLSMKFYQDKGVEEMTLYGCLFGGRAEDRRRFVF
jgi:hypothetical protein